MNPLNYSSCAEGRKLWFAVRHLASLVLAGWATCVSLGAAADINDYLGLPIVDVNLDFGGAVPTPGSEELIVTSVGIPLSMTDVRESIWHLFSLGYYSDIRVDASLRDGGVVLLYELIPIKVVDRLAFRGDLGLSGGDLREAIGERYGDRPQLGQVDDIAVFLRELYRDQGYLNTSIAISPLDRGGGLITLTIEIAAGEQARLATLVINGQVLETEASIFRRLDLRIGGHFDRGALEQRLADYVNNLKQDGHFEAVAGHTVEARPGGLQLDLTLTVDAGPRVLVEFEGDSLPVEIQDALVTVDRESSVDEDLLEDSNRRLLDYLRQRGFRRAITDYSRTGDDLELKIVYHVDRGPVVRVGGIEIEGYQVFSRAVLEDRLGVVIGDPFVEAALDEGVTAILAIYREVGYPEARVATEVIEESSPSGPIVHLRLTVTEGLRMVIGSIVIEGAPSSVVSRLQAVMTAHSGDVYERSVALVDRDAILQQLLFAFAHQLHEVYRIDRAHAFEQFLEKHGGENHQRMRKALPHAGYIAFTGTPLLKKDRQETVDTFGPIVHAYTMRRAVEVAARAWRFADRTHRVHWFSLFEDWSQVLWTLDLVHNNGRWTTVRESTGG